MARTKIKGESVAWLMERVHRAAMRAIERHWPCDAMVAAITMELYEEYLGTEFKKQMSENFQIEYPLDLSVCDLKE